MRLERGAPSAIRSFAAIFVLNAMITFSIGMVPPLLPVVADTWALSTIDVGVANAVYAFGRLASGYPASQLRARTGTRRTTFLGLGVLLGGTALCGLAPAFPVFLIGRLLMGAGGSAAFLAIFGELLDRTPARVRGRLANAFDATAILGETGGVLLAGTAGVVGWRGVFALVSAMLLASSWAWRPMGFRERRASPEEVGKAVPAPAGGRQLAPVYLAGFTMTLTWAGVLSTLVPLLGHGALGLSTAGLSVAMGTGYVAELLGLFGLSLVIDRSRREPIFLAGAVAVTTGGVILATTADVRAFVIGQVCVRAGFAVWMIPAMLLAERAGTPIAARYLAWYRIVLDSGMILGPLLLGSLAELVGERVAIGSAGALLLAGALALMRR
jgi:MFS family permease